MEAFTDEPGAAATHALHQQIKWGQPSEHRSRTPQNYFTEWMI